MLFKKDYKRAVAIVKDVQKADNVHGIVVAQAFVDFFSETDGKFDAEKFHEACKKEAKKPRRKERGTNACPEGGDHDFTLDVEYDATGQTVNCSKCGEAKPC